MDHNFSNFGRELHLGCSEAYPLKITYLKIFIGKEPYVLFLILCFFKPRFCIGIIDLTAYNVYFISAELQWPQRKILVPREICFIAYRKDLATFPVSFYHAFRISLINSLFLTLVF